MVNGRRKGSTFERTVAKLIVDAFAHKGVTNKDCYRTPLSGGHVHASGYDPGDLVMSSKLKKLFGVPLGTGKRKPFSVECKHYKKIDLFKLFQEQVTGEIPGWWDQAEFAAAASGAVPLLLMKQNNSQILAVVAIAPKVLGVRGEPVLRFALQNTGDNEWCWLYALPFQKLLRGIVDNG